MADDLEVWVERVAALKHDLAKYVAWRSANFDAEAWSGPMTPALGDALRADLLQTRRHATGWQSAWEVWDHHTRSWPRPLPHPELHRARAAVEALRGLEPILRGGDAVRLGQARATIATAQQDIRQSLLDLHRRLQKELQCRRS